MKAVATKAFAAPPRQATPPAAVTSSQPPSHAAVETPPQSAWLERLFWLAEHAPGVLRLIRKPLARLAFYASPAIRAGTLTNAGHILGSESTQGQRTALARRVVENFILFCHDVAQSTRRDVDGLLAQIEQIDGHEHYAAARQLGRGAIVVTAHLGSFEVGMAALRRQDACVHVVFRRDLVGRFEKMRSALRQKLGVIEAPVDDGWTVWMRLREAVMKNEVVVLQADRVMPGQKGQRIPVLGADMLLPAGPAKLALATGAPIVPVFSVRTPTGRVRLCVEPAIVVEDVDTAMQQLAEVVGKYISAYGDQWLMLQPAWCERRSPNDETGMTNEARMTNVE